MTTPIPKLTFTTHPWTLNVTGSNKWIYSGRLALRPIQWGALSLNVDTNSFRMVCPVVGPGPGYPPAALSKCNNGDFHQSATFMAASAGVEKWALTTINSLGSHFACSPVENPSKVQFFKATSVGLSYWGEVLIDSFGAGSVIIDDFAYIDLGNGTWRVVNLPSLVAGITVTELPPHTPQLDVGGFTYGPVLVTDSQHFYADRIGVEPIVKPCYFPLEAVSRQQVAAFIVATINWIVAHPGQTLPVPLQAVFEDVGLDYPTFGTVINQIGAAGIAGGRQCP